MKVIFALTLLSGVLFSQTEIVSIITGGGPYVLASVMAYLYWIERQERIEVHKERIALLERSLLVFGEVRDALRDLKTVVVGGRNA